MIVFMFKAMLGTLLFVCLVITLVGSMWVLKITLDELFTDDVTEKLRRFANAGHTKIVEGLLAVRERRGAGDRAGTEGTEETISDGRDNPQEIFLQAHKIIKEGRRD